MPKKVNKFRRFKLLLPTLLVVLLIGGGYFYYSGRSDKTPVAQKDEVVTTESGGTMNLSPATSVEQQESESKKTASAQPTAPTKTADGKVEVSIVLTSSDPSSVRAYIQGVVEDGGTCTATFTKGSVTKSGSSASVSNVSDTVCPPIDVGSLASGTWNLSYVYSSDKYAGSINKTVEL